MPLPIQDKIIDQTYLITLFAAVIILQWRFHAVDRFKEAFNKIIVGHAGDLRVSGYNIFSYFVLIGGWLILLSGTQNQPPQYNNIMLWRFFTAHWFILLAVVVVISVAGFYDIIRGLGSAMFLLGWHELIWMFAAAAAFGTVFLTYFWIFYVFLGSMIALYYLGGFRSMKLKDELMVVGSMIVFDLVWLAAGFPVSVQSYTGWTDLTNVSTALIENLSWVVPAMIIVFAEAGYLLAKFRGMRRSLSQRSEVNPVERNTGIIGTAVEESRPQERVHGPQPSDEERLDEPG